MKAQVVTFHCVLKNKLGQILSSSVNNDVINQFESNGNAGENQPLRGLVAGIQNVRSGEKRQFTIPADQAYGAYDPSLFLTVHRSELSEETPVQIGGQIAGRAREGEGKRNFRIVGIQGDQVMLDANHPLAGQDLVADIEVKEARDADDEDLRDPLTAAPRTYLH